MANKPVTLREVAEATGYAVNTVSRALKNQPVISEATRAVIQKAAQEMGYVPNRAATALRSGRSRTIAFVVGYLVNPFFGMLYEFIAEAAARLNYTIMLFSTNDQPDREADALRAAIAYGVEGVILLPCQRSDDAVQFLREQQLPFVLLAREFPGEPLDCVLCDEEQAGFLAARHLIEAGHRRLVYVGDDCDIYSIDRRRHGFLKAVREAGLMEDGVSTVLRSDADIRRDDALLAQTVARLRREEGVTGMVVFCDMQARHLMAALGRLGLRFPEAMGCIGFDNIDMITPSPIPLCSVGSDYQAMCNRAVELLQRRIQGDRGPVERIELPARVFCRDSCQSRQSTEPLIKNAQ